MSGKSNIPGTPPESWGDQPPIPGPTLEDAIIQPTTEAGEGPVSSRVILTFGRGDYHLLCRLARSADPPRYLWDCAIREGNWEGTSLTIAAPALGAPYAAMVLEKLIVLGARMVMALGWCGSLQPHVQAGDLVLPTGARPGDGTSGHYLVQGVGPTPDPTLVALLERQAERTALRWHSGLIWTTDAFYRETPSLVQHYQAQGILGVDLEVAALLAVGQFRRVPVAALLVVSDELADLTWRPKYRTPRFRQARDLAARLVLDAAAQWGGP